MNQVKMFILNNQIDIILISESHFTNKHYFKIPSYLIYHTTHPNGTAHDGIAIIINNNKRHHKLDNFKNEFFKASLWKLRIGLALLLFHLYIVLENI